VIEKTYLAIGASVFMHVSWNLLVRHQPKETYPLWWALAAHCLLLGPWGIYSLVTEVQWSSELFICLSISAFANTLYFFALKGAYARAQVTLVYPIIRSSPLLIALWSTLFFGEFLSKAAWAGIAFSVTGLFILAGAGWRNQDNRAIPWAIFAALATSLYSLSDKAATPLLPSFGAILGFITVGYLLSLAALTVQMRLQAGIWQPRLAPRPLLILMGGLSIGLAYALVIHAMRFFPAAEVVAFTNAGIVIASILSISVFRERSHWRSRVAGMLVICVGLTVLGISR